MILYCVTVTIDHEDEGEWISWMRDVHIPHIMETGCFEHARFYKVHEPHLEPDKSTFQVHYPCQSMERLERYRKQFAEKIQKEHQTRFEGRFTASRMVLSDLRL